MIGVVVIELGGEKRTLDFNLHSLMFLSKNLNSNPDQVDAKINELCSANPLRGLTQIIYAGILGHLENECIYDTDITLKMVSTWVGQSNINEFTSVWNAFSDVMGIPKASQEQIDAYTTKITPEVKKKPTQKR